MSAKNSLLNEYENKLHKMDAMSSELASKNQLFQELEETIQAQKEQIHTLKEEKHQEHLKLTDI